MYFKGRVPKKRKDRKIFQPLVEYAITRTELGARGLLPGPQPESRGLSSLARSWIASGAARIPKGSRGDAGAKGRDFSLLCYGSSITSLLCQPQTGSHTRIHNGQPLVVYPYRKFYLATERINY